jgi:hypothetical protein
MHTVYFHQRYSSNSFFLSFIRLYTLVSAFANTSSTRSPPSPLTIPSNALAPPLSPTVSLWSAETSLQACDDFFIRRVFSFDEWEYDQLEEPLPEDELNRYNDSLKSLKMFCNTESETKKTNLVQNTNSAFHKFHEFDLPPLDTTGTTEDSSTYNDSTSIPCCERIPRLFSDSFVRVNDHYLSSATSVSTIPEYIFVEKMKDRNHIFRHLDLIELEHDL